MECRSICQSLGPPHSDKVFLCVGDISMVVLLDFIHAEFVTMEIRLLFIQVLV